MRVGDSESSIDLHVRNRTGLEQDEQVTGREGVLQCERDELLDHIPNRCMGG